MAEVAWTQLGALMRKPGWRGSLVGVQRPQHCGQDAGASFQSCLFLAWSLPPPPWVRVIPGLEEGPDTSSYTISSGDSDDHTGENRALHLLLTLVFGI